MPFYPHPTIKYEVKDITVGAVCDFDMFSKQDEVTTRIREVAEQNMQEEIEQSLLLALAPHIKTKKDYSKGKIKQTMSLELAVRVR